MKLNLFNFKKIDIGKVNKYKDYQVIVLVQVVVVFLYFTTEDLLKLTGLYGPNSHYFIDILHLILAGGYALVLVGILRNFTNNRFIIYGTFLGLFLIYVLGILSENPFHQFFDEPKPYYFTIHFSLIFIEIMVISFAILDVFGRHKDTRNKIWGAACIYLTMAISFGSLYDLINIIQPNSFGEAVPLGFPSYIAGIHFSLATLGGVDPPFDNVSSIVHKVSVMESIGGNLYLVFLIGGIFSSPSSASENN